MCPPEGPDSFPIDRFIALRSTTKQEEKKEDRQDACLRKLKLRKTHAGKQHEKYRVYGLSQRREDIET